MSRVFTPRKMNAIEPEVRRYCQIELDALEGQRVRHHRGAGGEDADAGRSACCSASPKPTSRRSATHADQGLHLDSADDFSARFDEFSFSATEGSFGEYLDWRMDNPSDDVMTQLVQAEFEDHTGVTRRLTREEVLGYVNLLSGAGNETTTKLIGHAVRTLAEHPDQRRLLRDNPDLIPNAIEETLRFEAPSPIQARYVAEDVELPRPDRAEGQRDRVDRTARRTTTSASGARRRRNTTSPARSTITCRSATACTSASAPRSARLEGRVALDEILKRFPDWSIDYDRSERSHTSTVRGWDKLTVVLD